MFFFFFLDSLFQKLRGCLASFFLSLNFHHSSLNFSHTFGIITQFPSLNIFHTICEPHTYHSVQLLFFFPLPSKQKPEQEKKKEGGRHLKPNPKKKKKKKRVDRSKCATELWLVSPYVCLITKMSLSYELWKLKTAKMCFQFPWLITQKSEN